MSEYFVKLMEAKGEELNNDPDKRDDIEALEGEVMQLITEEGDTYKITESLGGVANLILTAGIANSGRNYLIVGGVTGTEPGIPLPGGLAILPVNRDSFTDLELTLLNTSIFSYFSGVLDAQGTSSARLDLPSIPGAAGITMHFAYCCNNPFDYVSNPMAIEVVP